MINWHIHSHMHKEWNRYLLRVFQRKLETDCSPDAITVWGYVQFVRSSCHWGCRSIWRRLGQGLSSTQWSVQVEELKVDADDCFHSLGHATWIRGA